MDDKQTENSKIKVGFKSEKKCSNIFAYNHVGFLIFLINYELNNKDNNTKTSS